MLRSFGSFVQCTGALVIWPFICWRDDLTLVHLYNCMNYGHWTTTASYLCPCVHWALDNYLCRPPVAIRSTQTVCYDPDVENWTWNYLFLNQSTIYWHTPPLLDISTFTILLISLLLNIIQLIDQCPPSWEAHACPPDLDLTKIQPLAAILTRDLLFSKFLWRHICIS